MIRIRVFNAHSKQRVRQKNIVDIAHRVLRGERCPNADLQIVFVSDRKMLGLNRKYLRHDYPTDVLSFPLGAESGLLEGEVYVNLDQARRQAADYRVSITEEVSRLAVHGVLHLVGYRDRNAKLRKEMTDRENRYLSNHGKQKRN